MNYYNLDILNELLEIGKSIKSEYVLINGDLAIGCDCHCNIMKTMKLKKIYHRTSFLVKNLGDFLKVINNMSIVPVLCYKDMFVKSIIFETNSGLQIQISDRKLDNYIIDKFNQVNAYINNIDFYFSADADLNDCQEFLERLNAKAKEGCKILNILNYPLAVYSSLLPVNKNDNISVTIYDLNKEDPTFLCRYSIKKKKNVEINVFVNYMKLPI